MSDKKTVLLIADNLRIGGIERNVLDQAYALSDLGIGVKIFVFDLNARLNVKDLIKLEKEIIERKKIEICQFPRGILQGISFLKRHLNLNNFLLIIDNSIKATPLLFFAKKISKNRTPVHCVIQQFPSLSEPKQRFKRMFYAQFSDRIIINSINYKSDWDFHVNKNFISKLFFKKKTHLIRNGVYIQRLNILKSRPLPDKMPKIRFIFIGRLKEWKGLKNFQILDEVAEKKADFLIYTPIKDPIYIEKFQRDFGSRIEFKFGMTLSDYYPRKGDIHFYPVEYPVEFVECESMSTNVIEMSLLKIPSLVTAGGTKNWPEIVSSNLIEEVIWSNKESIENAINCAISKEVNLSNYQKLLEACDINRNIKEHFSLSKLKIE